MQALIGPAICAECYEVGPEVAQAALNLPAARDHVCQREGRWHLDLKAINRQQLVEAGVRAENIAVSPLCTCCRADLLFSYRRLGPGCPEMGAFMAMKA